MADDKQLTVAELLARSKREPGAAPRRRRRNLESGGISVAELTGNLKRVEATPAQPKHSSVDIDETAPVIPAPADAVPADAASAQAESKADVKSETKAEAKPESKADEKSETSAKAKTPSVEETAVLSAIKDEPVQPDKAEIAEAKAVAVPKDAVDSESDAAVDADAADNEGAGDAEGAENAASLNPVSVVMLALFGIVLGAVVFKGFEILWEHLNHILVAVLALATTGVITGVIHALAVDKKKATLILAAAVGLVLTFGPYIGMVL